MIADVLIIVLLIFLVALVLLVSIASLVEERRVGVVQDLFGKGADLGQLV